MYDSLFPDDQIEPGSIRSAIVDADGTEVMPTSRRHALRLAGGGALAALAAARLHGSGLAQGTATGSVATPITPGSKVGGYAVIRTRMVKADKSSDELNQATREGLPQIVRSIAGFVEYYVIQNMETRERTGVSIYADKTGADESTRQVTDFLKSHGLADYYENVEPVVLEGAIVTATSA